MKMKVGEVRVADDADFQQFRQTCDSHQGWKMVYNKSNTNVWTRKNELSQFKQLKVRAIFPDLSLRVLYDMLHDSDYRQEWDDDMIEGCDICYLNPNNDIGYYSVRSPKPLKNRDFVTQRSWLYTEGEEFVIMNHSVNHAARPMTKKFVRGLSYLTGYYAKVHGAGTEMYYTTLCDIRGKLPSWIVNMATKYVAPRLATRVHKLGLKYDEWKKASKHPKWKPWVNPEQLVADRPQLNPADILVMEVTSDDSIDESNCVSEDTGYRQIIEAEATTSKK